MNIITTHPDQRCGFVAIVGRPNVGKSTLLNQLIGEKISITANKPQTTRHRILGVKTDGLNQAVFVDTPGIHAQAKRVINKEMNRAAKAALQDADIICFMVEALRWTAEDQQVLKQLQQVNRPVILLINKIDGIKNQDDLLPFIQARAAELTYAEVIPISAFNGKRIDTVFAQVCKNLPESVHFFPADQITDRDLSFRCCELIREKLTRSLGEELPYALTIEMEQVERRDNLMLMHAVIWVERDGQKKIVIGKDGQQIKQVGIQARKAIEKQVDTKVCLKLWVKVKEGWADSTKSLQRFGYLEHEAAI